jgi:hypothetical protein
MIRPLFKLGDLVRIVNGSDCYKANEEHGTLRGVVTGVRSINTKDECVLVSFKCSNGEFGECNQDALELIPQSEKWWRK